MTGNKKEYFMKKIIMSLFTVGIGLFFSCESPEELSPNVTPENAGIASLKATFIDGKGEFFPEKEAPYKDGDVIKIIIPWYYPVESLQETDITNMKVIASLPNNVFVTPGFGGMDLTKPNELIVTSPSGEKSKVTIIGERKKSSECKILEFSLPDAGLDGFLLEDEKMIGLVTGGVDLSNQKPKIVVSPHAIVTPDPELAQNFNEPVQYTVTAHDGTTSVYTVDEFVPKKIPYGFRKESARQLWYKSLSDMGADASSHMSTAIALSGKYLYINTRNQDCRYFDRFNGKYAGTLELPFKGSLNNFFMTNDDAGNILITNLKNAAGGKQTIYRVNAETGKSSLFIDVAHTYISGRKLSVKGDLDKDAIILSSIMNSKTVLYWEVVGGVLVSQNPKVFEIKDAQYKNWTNLADAQALTTNLSKGLFICGYPTKFGYFNADGSTAAYLDLDAAGYNANFVPHALDLVVFNNATYLAQNIQGAFSNKAEGFVYDVTVPMNIGNPMNDPRLLAYKTSGLPTSNNGNQTGDVLMKASDDGLKLIMYLMATNGGVAAYEFDCIDLNNIK